MRTWDYQLRQAVTNQGKASSIGAKRYPSGQDIIYQEKPEYPELYPELKTPPDGPRGVLSSLIPQFFPHLGLIRIFGWNIKFGRRLIPLNI